MCYNNLGGYDMQKGFTLMELLGVLVILSLLMIILAPNILEQLNSRKGEVSEAQEETIKSATELYVSNHPNQYKEGNTYCICLSTLQDSGTLSEKLTNEITGETDYNGVNITVKAHGNNDLTLGNCSSCS